MSLPLCLLPRHVYVLGTHDIFLFSISILYPWCQPYYMLQLFASVLIKPSSVFNCGFLDLLCLLYSMHLKLKRKRHPVLCMKNNLYGINFYKILFSRNYAHHSINKQQDFLCSRIRLNYSSMIFMVTYSYKYYYLLIRQVFHLVNYPKRVIFIPYII